VLSMVGRYFDRVHNPAAPPAPRAPVPRLLVGLDHDDQDLLLRALPARPTLDIRAQHQNVLGVEHLVPHRPSHRRTPIADMPSPTGTRRYRTPATPFRTETPRTHRTPGS
jgi:hypothetical protein